MAYYDHMSNFYANLPHMIMATVVIVAAVILSWHGTITGREAVAIIGTAGGFTMGAGSASTSGSVAGAPLIRLRSSPSVSAATNDQTQPAPAQSTPAQ